MSEIELAPSSVKPCSKCGVEYPHTAEFFHVDRRRKCGLTPQCKVCRGKTALAWNKGNKDRYNKNWMAFILTNAAIYLKEVQRENI